MSLQTKCGLFCLMLFGFYHLHVTSIALYTRIHKKSMRPITMQYSSTELLNLKALTAKKLGTKLSDDYLLISSTMKASQSRSEILDCIPQINAVNGDPGKFFKAKIVKEQDRFERELKNYKSICGQQKLMNEFIAIERFERNVMATVSKKTISVMIMEAGAIDLKKASAQLGPLRGADFVRIAKSMASSLAKIQAKGLVWTDLKTDNFVFVSNDGSNPARSDFFSSAFTCKAIDLESVVGSGKAIVDFSPEIAAPEQINLLTGGELSSQGGRSMDYTLAVSEPILARKESDIWALGISILHLYLGRAPISDRSDVNICFAKVRSFEAGVSDLGLSEIKNSNLNKLLKSMLNVNPKNRPSIGMVQIALNFCA